jgi:hypothetical protein
MCDGVPASQHSSRYYPFDLEARRGGMRATSGKSQEQPPTTFSIKSTSSNLCIQLKTLGDIDPRAPCFLSRSVSHNRDKENVLYFGKSKPNCHSKVLFSLVVDWSQGIRCAALGRVCCKLEMRYKHFRHRKFILVHGCVWLAAGFFALLKWIEYYNGLIRTRRATGTEWLSWLWFNGWNISVMNKYS